MKNGPHLIASNRIKRLRAQGYTKFSDTEVSSFAFGNRFAFKLCTAVVLIGVGSANQAILTAMMFVALAGVILPYHPFDYIYNHLLRQPLNKPKLPPRSKQLKFACAMATIWLATTIWLFCEGFTLSGYVVGGLLAATAALVSVTDICIPSIIYNSMIGDSV